VAAVVLALGAGIAWGCSDFLAIGTMSVVAPVSATAALLPVVVGVVSGEAPSSKQALGMALALAGAALAAFEPGRAGGGRRAVTGVGLADAVLNEEVTGSQRTGVAAALAGIGLVSLA
jgi:drug/metabolite transporter (DMT)-like permease